MVTTKTLIIFAVAFFLAFTVAVFIHYGYTTNPFIILSSADPSRCYGKSVAVRSTLKVFMYDLPPRFNVEMIGGFDAGGGLPDWPATSGIKKQHSVEYWMMASLVGGGAGDEFEVVRVFDGDDAEVFFVPFFSSLSFNTHGKNMTDPETEKDRKLQIDLLNILKKSKFWERSAGRDHVIPMSHPNAFRFLRDQVNASILVVADFGRYSRQMASLSKDIVSPYVHVVDSFVDDNSSDPFESRSTLLFFRGRTIRKDEGVIRSKLVNILKGHADVRYEESYATGGGIRKSTQGMRSSKFCLHPAGDTPSSCRLFDAIVSHCVPVIISDRIELPFENEIDYSEFSLFFSVNNALQPDYLVSQLRQTPKDRWLQMWRKLKNVSHHFEFQRPMKKDDAVNMIWKQVRYKLPAVNLAIHRNRRLRIPEWWSMR